jgi:hypothetical protein
MRPIAECESMMKRMIAVSIVSHGHGEMVECLAVALLGCNQVNRILLTINLPEELHLPQDERITVIRNPQPKGFGATQCGILIMSRNLFCVVNPDIELIGNPFIGTEIERTILLWRHHW